MKIAILKIGMNFLWNNPKDVVGGIGEAKAIIELLSETNKINIYSKIEKEENPIVNVSIKNINMFKNEEDILLIFNGFPGFDKNIIDIHEKQNNIINNFNGKVFYIFIDPELGLRNIEGINIKRKDLKIITSIFSRSIVKNKINENGNFIENIDNIYHFSFEKYPMLFEQLPYNKFPIYDLIYMGSFRKGKRLEKLKKYYSCVNNTHFFGRINKDNLKEHFDIMPIFHGAVKYEEIKYYINNSLCHVVIGDEFYEGNIFTPRIYECINYSTVCFIDIDMDPFRTLFKNDFNYVINKFDLISKMSYLKNNPSFRLQIINEQRKNINFKKHIYRKKLEDLLC